MIVSHQQRFVFVKTRKTAGTSIEIALRSLCGDGDVITGVGADEGVARTLDVGGPRNTEIALRNIDPRGLATLARRGRMPVFYNHMPARRIRAIIGRHTWNDYLTWAVERNPWDRALSLFYWQRRSRGCAGELTDFLRQARHERPMALSNWWLYTRNDKVLVDRVIRYERLESELSSLCGALGVTDALRLPNAKGGVRVDTRHYSEVMSTRDRDLVAAVCRREIAHFGYEF